MTQFGTPRGVYGVSQPFARLMSRLGETFIVRDVMVPREQIVYVAPGDSAAARDIVSRKNYSVVPASEDGETFPCVFDTRYGQQRTRVIVEERPTGIHDHIPDSTPLAEGFALFGAREWYFALRGNKTVGLITYWSFNSREFRVQLYAALSRLEELSRDALARGGLGRAGPEGLELKPEVVARVVQRFDNARKELGGNRFVDELDFHHVADALKKHVPWRMYLNDRLGQSLSDSQYDQLYVFTRLRDAVMHGRVLFPTYRRFEKETKRIGNMIKLIGHLEAYFDSIGG